MASLNGFNAAEVEPQKNFEPIPNGKYLAAIVESDSKPTKAGNGSRLNLTLEILDGDYKGRKLWTGLNLENPSQQAVNIAKAELSSICRAVGVMNPQDSVELHNLPMVIRVVCKKRQDSDEMQNEIKGYAAKDAAPKTSAGAPGSKPSWMK